MIPECFFGFLIVFEEYDGTGTLQNHCVLSLFSEPVCNQSDLTELFVS